jgi:hypothetical protein
MISSRLLLSEANPSFLSKSSISSDVEGLIDNFYLVVFISENPNLLIDDPNDSFNFFFFLIFYMQLL